jgi:hypothetical protein
MEQSKLRRSESSRICLEIKNEIERAGMVIRASHATLSRSGLSHDRVVSISIQRLLQSLPRLGGWMPGSGKYSSMLNDLLDAGTTLIEERFVEFDPDGPSEWLVRLTPRGMLVRDDWGQTTRYPVLWTRSDQQPAE